MEGCTYFASKSTARNKAASKLPDIKVSSKEAEGVRAALHDLPVRYVNAKNSLRAASEGSFHEWLFLLK